jgi:hypothetical protein
MLRNSRNLSITLVLLVLVGGCVSMPVDYEFKAQIDVGTFYPMIDVIRVGVLSFN